MPYSVTRQQIIDAAKSLVGGSDVLPGLAAPNIVNTVNLDAQHCGDGRTGHLAAQVLNLTYLLLSQFGVWMLGSASQPFGVLARIVVVASRSVGYVNASRATIARRGSTLANHVAGIIGIRSKKKVERIDTLRVVASMADNVRLWVNAIVEPVRDAVRSTHLLLFVTTNGKGAVSAQRTVSRPVPTAGWLNRNFSPKVDAFLKGKNRKATMQNRHNLLLNSRLCLEGFPVFQARGGLRLF